MHADTQAPRPVAEFNDIYEAMLLALEPDIRIARIRAQACQDALAEWLETPTFLRAGQHGRTVRLTEAAEAAEAHVDSLRAYVALVRCVHTLESPGLARWVLHPVEA